MQEHQENQPAPRSPTNPIIASDLKKPSIWLATWFGCGFMRPAPGTWGSVGALPFGIILFAATGLIGFITSIIIVTIVGLWASDKFEKITQTHDNKMIVIDEVAGQWIALLPVFYFTGIDSLFIALAFGLFRFFDIIKPWPVSYFDRHVDGALGVMADDLVAGAFAALIISGGIYAGFS